MENKKNIVLCGFMGSGKTTIGRRLAKLTNRRFVDIDRLIEQETGLTIREIFSQKGEQEFRRLESLAAQRLAAQQNLVVATGGGTLLNLENAQALRKTGVIVLLDAPLAAIRNRLKNDTSRPLLQRADKDEEMERLYRLRIPAYRSVSDFSVPAAGSLGKITNEILARLSPEGGPQGKTVRVTVQNPLGSPRQAGGVYPVNCGHVEGSSRRTYLLGVHCPVPACTGRVAAVIHRDGALEDIWVVVPPRYRCPPQEIRRLTQFEGPFCDSCYEFLD